MRVTGFNAMLGLIYDFIGRVPQVNADADETDGSKTGAPPAQPTADRADGAKSGDNT